MDNSPNLHDTLRALTRAALAEVLGPSQCFAGFEAWRFAGEERPATAGSFWVILERGDGCAVSILPPAYANGPLLLPRRIVVRSPQDIDSLVRSVVGGPLPGQSVAPAHPQRAAPD